jgi:hypothetical protein
MMARSWTGRSQECGTGGTAAMFGDSMMARSWTGRSQESATGGRAAMFGGSSNLSELDRVRNEVRVGVSETVVRQPFGAG